MPTNVPPAAPTFPPAFRDPWRCSYSKEQIAAASGRQIGQQISEEYTAESSSEHPIVLIGVLKGAAIFLADLARCDPRVDNTFDFVAVSSYGRARVSSGAR